MTATNLLVAGGSLCDRFNSDVAGCCTGFQLLVFSVVLFWNKVNMKMSSAILVFFTAKMPKLMIQHRKRHLALALMLVQLNYTVSRLWIHPVNNMRFEKSEFNGLYWGNYQYQDKFFNWYHMSMKQFDDLLGIIQRRIRKKNTNFRESVSPEKQLCITLT